MDRFFDQGKKNKTPTAFNKNKQKKTQKSEELEFKQK